MNKDFSNFKTGYFILYKNEGTMFRNLIEKHQIKQGFSEEDSKYTHIEISIGGKYAINAKFPIIKLTNVYETHFGKYIKIVKHKHQDYNKKRKDITIECLKRINTPYGLGVLWFVFKNQFKNNIFSKVGDFCSELCGYGLKKCLIDDCKNKYEDILPKKYDQLYPADFLNKNYFEVVWEGYITVESKDK